MLHSLLRTAVLVLAGAALATPAGLAGQDAVIPVPANVRAEGLPPIPAAIATRLATYGQFRRAQLLAWHATRREMLVTTTTEKVMQVHAVGSPGAAPKVLTNVAGGVTVAAAYSPLGGDWFVYRKDPDARETHQLWRQEPGAAPVILTDGTSRNGTPAWSAKSGRIAFDSNKRNGKDRDIYVMDPKDPSTMRMLSQVSGSWYVAAWSPDDTTIIAVEMLPGNNTALWSVDVASGKRTRADRGLVSVDLVLNSVLGRRPRHLCGQQPRVRIRARVAAPDGDVDGTHEGRRLGRVSRHFSGWRDARHCVRP